MDYDLSNQKKLNGFKVEAERWKKVEADLEPKSAKRGPHIQPAKRKKKRK